MPALPPYLVAALAEEAQGLPQVQVALLEHPASKEGIEMKCIIIIMIITASAAMAQEKATAKVTFFRSNGGIRGNTLFSCDHDRYKIKVYQGEDKIIQIRRGKFVTLNLAPGSYTFKSSRSKPVEVTLKDGDQVYLRPRQSCGGAFRALEAIDVVPCSEAVDESKTLDAIDAKDIYVDTKKVDNQKYFVGSCGKA